MARDREALITGIGLVSSLGEGLDAHWEGLNKVGHEGPKPDFDSFAPFPVFAMTPLSLDRQIPKRGDQRQMEAWQRIGTYAAGLALESAGLKGNADLLGTMDMIVAAGGGERDYNVDSVILSGISGANDQGAFLNEHLQSDLRPTLFLAQLSNLLAGNISIVHGVAGSSRTFMGEEAAGADGIRIACARIAAGQGDLFLVGGSYNAERPDVLLHYQMGGALWQSPTAPSPGPAGDQKSQPEHSVPGVWARQATGGGLILGSLGCFLVIESRAHAERRSATPLAHIAAIQTGRCRRSPGEATANATAQLAGMKHLLASDSTAVISGASGVAAATQEEQAFLRSAGWPVRATATAFGHGLEPSFPANLALAADAVGRGHLFAPLEEAEQAMDAPLRQVLVTSWGHWRGEALAVVTAA
jgi:3-oxoacyl-[acyl-carrier-protein] synthase II